MIALPARLCDHAAVISDCGRYRYWLMRRTAVLPGRKALFVMLNPSTADASLNDPTIRRVIHFATCMGAAELAVVNLFALRSPSPKALLAGDDPVGPLNDDAISYGCRWADVIVAAWGATPAGPPWFRTLHRDRVAAFQQRAVGGIKALALTAGGDPRHPLYLRNDCTPVAWNPSGAIITEGKAA